MFNDSWHVGSESLKTRTSRFLELAVCFPLILLYSSLLQLFLAQCFCSLTVRELLGAHFTHWFILYIQSDAKRHSLELYARYV